MGEVRRGKSVRGSRTTDGQRVVPVSKTPEYRAWAGVIQRTTNPNCSTYAYYGGRGIKCCRAWRESFEAFLADVGHRPSPDHSLNRLDNDGDYEPTNVTWSTRTEQQQNRSSNLNLTARGETLCVTEWARRLGVPVTTLQKRIQLGWSDEQTVTTPVASRTRRAA